MNSPRCSPDANPDRAFDDVGVDIDTTAVEEAGQAFPPRERIADRFSELCLLTDQSELGAQPEFEFIDDRPAPVQPGVASFLGAAATDILGSGHPVAASSSWPFRAI